MARTGKTVSAFHSVLTAIPTHPKNFRTNRMWSKIKETIGNAKSLQQLKRDASSNYVDRDPVYLTTPDGKSKVKLEAVDEDRSKIKRRRYQITFGSYLCRWRDHVQEVYHVDETSW